MFKIVTCDLDETLLKKDGSISHENILAIKRIIKQGIKFIPNTGRSFLSIENLLKTLNLFQKSGQYVISYNGSAVVENKNNKVIINHQMPYEEAKKVFEIALAFNRKDVQIYTLNNLYIYKPLKSDEVYLRTRGVKYHKIFKKDFYPFKNKKIVKIIAANPDKRKRLKLRSIIEKKFLNRINVTFSSNLYTEINHYKVNKGKAVLDLAKRLGIKKNQIIAIGDNNNDLPMLENVGLPISVSNGIPIVKKVAKFVTKNNYEKGVAEAIFHFILQPSTDKN